MIEAAPPSKRITMPDIDILVDLSVYRPEAVKKAAYRLGDRAVALIESDGGGRLRVSLTPRSEKAGPAEVLRADFLQELLDQELRESIAEQTEKVRNLLLAHAFSGLSPVDDVAETADHREDPIGIGRSQAR